MDLKIPTPRRRPPSRLPDHLILWGVAVATLALFATSRDFYRGKAEIADAVPFTAAFLATGYFLSGLSRIWECTDRTRLAGLVLPCFMAVVMAYFVLGCGAGFIQPTATAIAVLAQVVSLIVVGARAR